MKAALITVSVVCIALLTMALTHDSPQDTFATYATIAYSTEGKNIYIYYGETRQEEIAIKKGENVNDKLVNALNDMSKKGFELVSMNTHAFNFNLNKEQSLSTYDGNYIEFYYTLKKSK